ncbi:type II toxin-antitoxin system RelE family toxin [Archaeoglobus sp.]
MNSVFLHKRVIKFLEKLEEKRRENVLRVLKSLGRFPLIRADIKKIGKTTYRMRVGEIRVIFDYDKEKNKIFVKLVDFRGRVYKRI